MLAETIFTGTELLLGQILNTNAQYLQQTLAANGIDLYYQVTVGDNLKRLSQAITQASQRSDLIVIGGGLGPTQDDLSREALAGALGLTLHEDSRALAIVERFFKMRGLQMSKNNLKQALIPAGGVILDNPVGTAPGIYLVHAGKRYALLPGPPEEFKLMLDEQLLPLLRGEAGSASTVIKSRILKLCGIGESVIDEKLGSLLKSLNPTVAPTARYWDVHLRITSKADSSVEADRLNLEMEKRIREMLGEHIYGVDDETLPGVLGRLLAEKQLTLALAEACTGGYLSQLLASFPESNSSLILAVVSDEVKLKRLLNPDPAPGYNGCLAEGIKKLAGSDIGLAVTTPDGLKHPGSGVWTVKVSVALPESLLDYEVKLRGTNRDLMQKAAQACLVLLWRALRQGL